MKMKHKLNVAGWMCIPMVLLMMACEVEFSPNADWKDVPVVYGVVDQDDDTTWVRVERCFLGEGNITSYGAISDSINYAKGSIAVSMAAYRQGEMVDTFDFEYTERNRAEGQFAYEAQPVYYALTGGRLAKVDECKLYVRRVADGKLIASAQTYLVKQTNDELVTEPNTRVKFATGRTTTIKWNGLENGRRYQPRVVLYYEEDGVVKSEDFLCGDVKVTGTSNSYSCSYERVSLLTELRERLAGDTGRKRLIDTVDLFLTTCNEDLHAYMMTTDATLQGLGNEQSYSNVEGGVGVFGARRTHLHKWVPVNVAVKAGRNIDDNNAGFLWCLNQLGIGEWVL